MKIQYTAIACIALLACAFLACDDDDSGESSGTNSYLPLKIGNYWEFVNIPEIGINYTVRTEVTRVVSFNENEYFELVNIQNSGGQTYRDTTYYRITQQGYVYTWRRGWTIEENPMRLYADDDDTWKYETNYDAEANITVNEIDDLELGDKKLDNCKSFSFDIEQWADEEHSIVLAPRIGFVQRLVGFGVSSRLVKASVNGKEYTF